MKKIKKLLFSFAYSDSVTNLVKGSFKFRVCPQIFSILLNFFYELLCAVIVGEGKVIYHAVEGKIITYNNTLCCKIDLVFFEEFYVLRFCGIYKNQIKKTFERVSKGIPVNGCDAVIKSCSLKIFYSLKVTVYIEFDCCYFDVVCELCKTD